MLGANMRYWSRDQKLMLASLCVAIAVGGIDVLVPIYLPELRRALGRDGDPPVIVTPSESALAPISEDPQYSTTEIIRPGTTIGDRHTLQWRALANFSYESGLRWGTIEVGMLRKAVEQKLGPIKCLPEEDTKGDYCACRGLYNDIALLLDLRNPETREDPGICTHSHSRLDKLTVLLPESERYASHGTIVGVLRSHLPRMRHVQGSEPQASDERSHHRPTYTVADGSYVLTINYEAGAIEVGRAESHWSR